MQINRKRPSPTSHPSKLRSTSLDQRSANYGPWTKIGWLFLHSLWASLHRIALWGPSQAPPSPSVCSFPAPSLAAAQDWHQGCIYEVGTCCWPLSGSREWNSILTAGDVVNSSKTLIPHPSPSPHNWAPPPLYQPYWLVALSSGECLQLMVTGHKASPPPWMAHLGQLMCMYVRGEWRGGLKFSLVM